MTDVSIESIEELDFDYVPPCEATWVINGETIQKHNESVPADWAVLVRSECCLPSCVRYWCDDCLQQKLNATLVACSGCGVIHPGLRMADLIISITRIGENHG